MGGGQKALRVFLVVPNVLGGGDHAGQPFGALAFLALEMFAAAFERRFGNHAVEHFSALSSRRKYPGHAGTKRRFWQAFAYRGRKLAEGSHFVLQTHDSGDSSRTDHSCHCFRRLVSIDAKYHIIWIKKSEKTPQQELAVTRKRMKEIKDAD
jgi:hypothetical protein